MDTHYKKMLNQPIEVRYEDKDCFALVKQGTNEVICHVRVMSLPEPHFNLGYAIEEAWNNYYIHGKTHQVQQLIDEVLRFKEVSENEFYERSERE